MMELPPMYQARQIFPRPVVEDIYGAVRRELDKLDLKARIRRGWKVGITAGSRGIRNLDQILKAAVEYIAGLGGVPSLIAAMGSHGGATIQGQLKMLDSLGISESSMGAPVVACAECEAIARTPGGLAVFILKSALNLDGILVINRVKTHTSFKGSLESGLVKGLVVGLGGPDGARQFHGIGPERLAQLLVDAGSIIINELPVMGGLAIVENAYEETALIRAVPGEEMIEREPELLVYSKSLMPALPVDEIDLLVVREMGKNFSGTGMDTNIIGRARARGIKEPEKPSIKRIAVLDLSEQSGGNATGIGLADFTTKRLVDAMDRKATYLNCLTSTFVMRAAIPMYFDTDRELMEAALFSLSAIPPADLRVVVIPNTLVLTECHVSRAVAEDLRGRSGVDIGNELERFMFDAEDKMLLGPG
jgi:hypothetical protein